MWWCVDGDQPTTDLFTSWTAAEITCFVWLVCVCGSASIHLLVVVGESLHFAQTGFKCSGIPVCGCSGCVDVW